MLLHENRRIVHFNITGNPKAKWVAQQIIAAGYGAKYLLRDNDGVYGEYFQERVKHMGIEEVKTVPQSP